MAKVTNIPDTDHVLRWAQPKKHLLWNAETKKFDGCDHALFKLRSDDKFVAKYGGIEKSLSVNHVEHFKGTDKERLKQTVEDYRDGLKSLTPSVTLSKNAPFSKLNVSELKEMCGKHGAKIRVVHDAKPTARIKSHGSITQLPQDNNLLLDDLCKLAFQNLMSAEEALK